MAAVEDTVCQPLTLMCMGVHVLTPTYIYTDMNPYNKESTEFSPYVHVSGYVGDLNSDPGRAEHDLSPTEPSPQHHHFLSDFRRAKHLQDTSSMAPHTHSTARRGSLSALPV